MKLLPICPVLTALLPPRGGLAVATQALTQGLDEAALLHAPHAPRDAAEPDWRSAYQRRRAQDDEPNPAPTPDASNAVPPLTPWAAREVAPDVPIVGATAPTTATTATTERVDALRRLAEPNAATQPTARVWEVELPVAGGVAGPAWQLHVEQAQPQAPLTLELRVPPAAQTQARQQLSDLDRRLRETGHDVLRPRVRDAQASRRSRPVDEVDS